MPGQHCCNCGDKLTAVNGYKRKGKNPSFASWCKKCNMDNTIYKTYRMEPSHFVYINGKKHRYVSPEPKAEAWTIYGKTANHKSVFLADYNTKQEATDALFIYLNEIYTNNNGKLCPFCQSPNLNPQERVQIDGLSGSQIIYCESCEKEWQDLYSLTGICPAE